MRISFRRLMTAAVLVFAMAMPVTSHAWFFFFIPGLFSSNDKKTVSDLEQKKDWVGIHELAEKRLGTATGDLEAAWRGIDGYALLELNRCNDAIPQLRRSNQLKGDNNDVINNLGRCQLNTGQLDDALSTFREVIGKNPEFWPAYYNAGLTLVRKRDPDGARGYLEQLRPRNMVWASKLEGELQQAEREIEQGKIATANREREEKERADRERLAKEELDAKARADAAAAIEKIRTEEAQTASEAAKSLETRLKDLKRLYSRGLITKDVYDARQRELLAQH